MREVWAVIKKPLAIASAFCALSAAVAWTFGYTEIGLFFLPVIPIQALGVFGTAAIVMSWND